jgi:hypothetical protein
MRLFLDTEFNGFMGRLMSMALVPEDNTKREFYEELIMTDQLDPWVKDNVVPHMHGVPLTRNEFQQRLRQYLWEMGDFTIVADWPDDIRHLCESLITGPGESIWPLRNIKFELDWSIKYQSEVPHHALHDARAIRHDYLHIKTK